MYIAAVLSCLHGAAMEWVATGIYPFVGLMRWIIPSTPIQALAAAASAAARALSLAMVAAASAPMYCDHIAGQRVFDHSPVTVALDWSLPRSAASPSPFHCGLRLLGDGGGVHRFHHR